MTTTTPLPPATPGTANGIPFSPADLGLLADALHDYRDRLRAVIERYDEAPGASDLAAAESETLPPAPGSVLAGLHATESLLARIESL
jgi:hypothetical protein